MLQDALHYFFVAVVFDVVAAEHSYVKKHLFALVLADVISFIHFNLFPFIESALQEGKIGFGHVGFGVHIVRVFWFCPELDELTIVGREQGCWF